MDTSTASTETQTPTMLGLLDDVTALLRSHPDLPTPVVTAWPTPSIDVDWHVQIWGDTGAAAQKRTARRILRAIGGKWNKEAGSSLLRFRQSLADGRIKLQVAVDRDAVCERVVVGHEDVTIPAVEAQPEHVETREVIEWICSPVLAGSVAEDTDNLPCGCPADTPVREVDEHNVQCTGCGLVSA